MLFGLVSLVIVTIRKTWWCVGVKESKRKKEENECERIWKEKWDE